MLLENGSCTDTLATVGRHVYVSHDMLCNTRMQTRVRRIPVRDEISPRLVQCPTLHHATAAAAKYRPAFRQRPLCNGSQIATRLPQIRRRSE